MCLDDSWVLANSSVAPDRFIVAWCRGWEGVVNCQKPNIYLEPAASAGVIQLAFETSHTDQDKNSN